MEAETKAAEFRAVFDRLRAEIGKVIVGSDNVVDGVLTSLFAGGHCLLEGVPGLGKTLLIRTLSDSLSLEFSRIQFTPDLMPADIIGTHMLAEDDRGNRDFTFRPGPIFANIVLADEVNRATPKTQSALLEAMQEHTVSVARQTHRLEEPFFVMATQNPIEMEGTYPLPEAQLDRFLFKVLVAYPKAEDLHAILDRTTRAESPHAAAVIDGANIRKWQAFARDVPSAPPVTGYAVRLVLATQPGGPQAPDTVRRFVRFGSSPRGAQALMLGAKIEALRAGRFNVAFEDIRRTAHSALRHRVLLNFEAEAEGIAPDAVVDAILEHVQTAAKVA